MMKKTIKLLISMTLACSLALSAAACDFEGVMNGFIDDPMGTIGGIFNPNEDPEDPDGGNEGEQENPDDGIQGGENEDNNGQQQNKTVNVTFEVEGGDAVEGKTVTIGEAYTLPTPTKEGYDFLGWYFGGDKVEQTGVWGQTDGSVLLRASWEVKTYTVKFVSDGGVATPADITVAYMQTCAVSNDANIRPTRTGYVFCGWMWGDLGLYFDEAEYSWEYTDKYDGNDDDVITLTAYWKPIEYTLSLQCDKGTAVGEFTHNQKFTIENIPSLTAKYELAGYKFLGWSLDGETVIESVTEEMLADLGDSTVLTLEAVWETIEYSIVYANTKGESNSNATTFTVENGEVALKALPGEENQFKGWKIGDKTVTKLDASIVQYADANGVITITATWGGSSWTANY